MDRNIPFLKLLLEEMFALETPIKSIDFQAQELIANNSKTAVDLFIKDEKDHIFLVEMQIKKERHFIERCLFYLAKSMSRYLGKKSDKHKLKPSKILAVCDFNLFEDSDNHITNHKIVDIKNNTTTTEALEMCFLELPKFSNYYATANANNTGNFKSACDKFAFFLNNFKDDNYADICDKDPHLSKLLSSFGMVKLTEEEQAVLEMAAWEDAD